MGKLFKNTALISILTLASRILGVVRDALIAMVFGTSAQSDAFFIAFRPFDLSRKLFSEGTLSISFVPVFSKILQKESHSNAVTFVFSFFCFLSLISVVFMVSGIVFAPLLIKLIAPGFIADSATSELTLVLFKVMLPYLWCVFILALCMGVLNTLGNFGSPAIAPVVFNIIIIIFTLFVCNQLNVPVIGLAVGVTIGGIVQLMIQIPFMIRHKMFDFKSFNLFEPHVRRVIKIMIPCMIGAASYQINIMVASFFASKLPQGSVSYLYYADRLVQFPLALFAISVATVILPELSRKANSGNIDAIAPIFTNGVKLVFFIVIPAMAGLMALNQEIITFLFGQGKFDQTAIKMTSQCLFYLVTGLWAFTGVRIFVTLFYSLENFMSPFYCGLISIGINFLGCYMLVDHFGLTGLVLSVSIASIFGFILLFFQLPSQAKINKKELLFSACRSLFVSVIMFVLVKLAVVFLIQESAGKLIYGAGLAGGIVFGMVAYLGLNILISNPDYTMVKKSLIEKINDKK